LTGFCPSSYTGSVEEIYQGLLFGTDDEARSQEARRRRVFEETRERKELRGQAWRQGNPLPEDIYRYSAVDAALDGCPAPMLPFGELAVFGDRWTWAWNWAHPKQAQARQARRDRWNEGYTNARPYVLAYAARKRAESLGCRIGSRRRIEQRYRFADSELPIPCYWCLRLTERYQRHVDHKIPLSRGGEHRASNTCIACWHCNVSKGDQLPDEFRFTVVEERKRNVEVLRSIGNIAEKDSAFWDAFFRK
jgi:5-methylcytosine-specific restriction endonuclease McrA